MVRRVLVTIPPERVRPVLELLDELRHCHDLCVTPGDTTCGEFGKTIISFKCIDKKLGFILSELEKVGIGIEFGTIDLISLEATMPKITSRIDSRGKAVPNRISSITDRLTIPEIFNAIDTQCHMTFDYLIMCATAAMICAVGLVNDNVVLVVASMIVSPLMGPILSLVYGTTMKDHRMAMKGFRTELSGFAILFVFGMICGLVNHPFDPLEIGKGPIGSFQIYSRGENMNLLVGTLIAAPSGVALAIAVVSDVVAPFVGVAIAAALLPPIVNSGLTLMLGILAWHSVGWDSVTDRYMTIAYTSFILFMINLTLIYLLGVVTFWLKNISPSIVYDKGKYLSRYSTFDMVSPAKYASTIHKELRSKSDDRQAALLHKDTIGLDDLSSTSSMDDSEVEYNRRRNEPR